MIPHAYLAFAKARFRLDWKGIHGLPHWARVRRNGLWLAPYTQADPAVVEAFAFVHDLERHNDDYDPEHGLRAARLAHEVHGSLLGLTSTQVRQVCTACEGHSDGLHSSDPTVARFGARRHRP